MRPNRKITEQQPPSSENKKTCPVNTTPSVLLLFRRLLAHLNPKQFFSISVTVINVITLNKIIIKTL